MDIVQERANEIFNKCATPAAGKLTSLQSSNAPLDAVALKDLLTPIFGPDIRISDSFANVRTTECNVQYIVDKSGNSGGENKVYVQITRFTTPLAAEAKMKACLRSFEGDLSKGSWPAKIGSYSLRTLCEVFWVRNTIFGKVSSSFLTGSCGSSMIVSPLIFVNQIRLSLKARLS